MIGVLSDDCVGTGPPAGSSTDSGSNIIMVSGIERLHTDHVCQSHGGLALGKAGQIRCERDDIAAAMARRKIGPAAIPEIDAERAEVLVGARRVPRHILMALDPSVWQPALQQ